MDNLDKCILVLIIIFIFAVEILLGIYFNMDWSTVLIALAAFAESLIGLYLFNKKRGNKNETFKQQMKDFKETTEKILYDF